MRLRKISASCVSLVAGALLLSSCADSHEGLYNLYSVESANERMPSVSLNRRESNVEINLDRFGMVSDKQRMRIGHIIKQVSGNHPNAAHMTIFGQERLAPRQLYLAAMGYGVPESNIEYVQESRHAGKPVPFSYMVTVERYYADVPDCEYRSQPANNSFSRRANPVFIENARCRSVRNLAQSVADPADFRGKDTVIQLDPVTPQPAPVRTPKVVEPKDDMTSEDTDNDAGQDAVVSPSEPIN